MDKHNLRSDELWAVLDKNARVMYTQGGSSTRSRLMVYPTEALAESAIRKSYGAGGAAKLGLKVLQVYPIQYATACA